MSAENNAANAETIWLKNYAPPNYLIPEVALNFELGDNGTLVTATLKVMANSDGKTGAPLLLNGGDQELVSIRVNDIELGSDRYQRTQSELIIGDVPEEFTLEIVNRLLPEKNSSLNGLYRSGSIFCTQCEAEGFRKITFFPDRPDVMSKYTVTISANPADCPVMLSNGNLVDEGFHDDGRHFVTWEDPFPKPSYLFALVAGRLEKIQDQFTTASGRNVSLQIFTEPHNIDKCDHAMASLKRSMVWDEKVYGREYDLDLFNIVAVDDFNMGAMENKSLNIFNSKYVLARPDTATDMDYLKIEAVVAHEYFHNWTGNRITCRDWFQLSLKEGLTVFRDQSFTSEHNSPVVKRIQDVRVLRNSQFTEDAGPMAHPVRPDHYIEINNFYTVTVYEKGAEVVRMQHKLLGPELFRKATDLYFERHDGQAVTVEDFVACMAQLSGRDMSQFMNWYNQKGTPQLNATWTHDEGTNTLTLTLEQSAPSSYKESEKAAWQPHHIPVAVGMVCGETGAELLPEGTRVLELRELCQSFAFPAMAAGTIPSVLREFSAPVILKTQHSMEQTLFLMAHDADSFNRWEAGQQVAQTLLTQWIGQFQDAPYGTKVQDVVTFDEAWLKAVAQLLEKAMDDPELTREALILPTEQRLGDTMKVVDVEAIHAVREFAVCAIARRFENEMAQLHTQLDPSQTTHRGLRNLLLGLLARLQKPDHIQLATQQQAQAKNMSDELGALRALERLDIPERQTALDRFYEKWKGQRLVIDKWFALQSESQLPGAVDRVEALIEHSDFEITNPNRARSVVGAFAMGNTRHFHDAGGRGYKFLADMVLKLDAINPQVASRMVKAFNPWKRYDQGRQALIRAQLERLKASPTISKDVFEVVSRNLDS